MKFLRTWVLAFFLLGSAPALATPLVADLSHYNIEMTSRFVGERIFLFGARNDPGDVVVIIRGPQQDVTVWHKERVAGMWVNARHETFHRVPGFLWIASSRPMEQLSHGDLLNKLGIRFNPLNDESPESSMFSEAFVQSQVGRGLYPLKAVPLQFMGETLFKTEIPFPDTTPTGDYTAEIYLLSDGEIVGMQSTPIHAAKSGLDAWITQWAHEQPLTYGIWAVVIALAGGWTVNRLLNRT